MATEHDTPVDFGRVSRIKGRIFEGLSFGASVLGLVALAVLLIYVFMDAFDLANASPEWLLTYYITLVLPLIGFCLYSVGSKTLARQTAVALGGGLVVTAVLFTGFEQFVRDIPALTWQLTYLFVVVTPITGYVIFRGALEPAGKAGFGLVGRLLGGTALGIALGILFFMFDPVVWFFAYTLGVGCALVADVAGRVHSRFSGLVVPAGSVGVVVGTLLRTQASVRPTDELLFVLLFGLPLAVTGVWLASQQESHWLVPGLAAVAPLTVFGVGVTQASSIWSVQAGAATLTGAVIATVLVLVLSVFGLREDGIGLRVRSPGVLGVQTPVRLVGGMLAGAVIVWVAERVIHLLLVYKVTVYPDQELIFLWTFAVPLAGIAASLVYVREGSLGGAAGVGAIPLAAGLAGFVLGAETVLPAGSMIILLSVTATVITLFAHTVVNDGDGVAGLALPALLAGGIVSGRLLVDSFGFQTPDAWLTLSYLTNAPSRNAAEAGLFPAIVGSVVIIALVAVIAFVLGVGTAVFLEEYTSDTGWIGLFTRLIQINIANLAAVPSVVYGLLGLALFANLLGFGFGTAVTISLTLALLILPITVVSAQEAIRAVPGEMRRGSDAMGATRWQTTKNIVLPQAFPGILTGVILALGRAIGETAPLIMVGAATTVFSAPNSLSSKLSAMPLQVFAWSTFFQEEFRYGVLAAGVVTLLIVLLGMNATAIVLRNRAERDA